MKAGAEIHFLAGQLFTLGVAALAVGPRMPFDDKNKFNKIGGNLSYPFRKALLGLVLLGTFRVLVCHVMFDRLVMLDAILGTIHVIGQSFLCLTTAYLLQVQLSRVIHIVPGQSLTTILLIVASLTMLGVWLGHAFHSNWNALQHLAEAISCIGVLQTLRTYSSVTSSSASSRGGGGAFFLTQLIQWMEYWFLVTSLLAFVGEATRGWILVKYHHDDEDHPIVVFLEAIQHNQDNGIDDWTRLLIHSIYLNSLDELQHFTPADASDRNHNTNANHGPAQSSQHQDDDNNHDTTPLVAIVPSTSHNQDLVVVGTKSPPPLRARHYPEKQTA